MAAAGLLHDVLEDTAVSADELRARFGAGVATLVVAVSEDALGGSYRARKQRLREQVRRAGGDAAIVFAADKISKVRELTVASEHDAAAAANGRGRDDTRREHVRRLQVEHYHESLAMLRDVVPRHALVDRLAEELAGCPKPRYATRARRGARHAAGHRPFTWPAAPRR